MSEASRILREKARRIREDVAWDTKWGTNFPKEKIDKPLERARRLEEAAGTVEGKKE